MTMPFLTTLLTNGKAAAVGAGTVIAAQVALQAHTDVHVILTRDFGLRLLFSGLAAGWQAVACPVGSLHTATSTPTGGERVQAVMTAPAWLPFGESEE